MAERNLPGIASEQIPALRQSHGEEDLDPKVEEIATLDNERKRRKCRTASKIPPTSSFIPAPRITPEGAPAK